MTIYDLPRPPRIVGPDIKPEEALQRIAAWADGLQAKLQDIVDTLARQSVQRGEPLQLVQASASELNAASKYRAGGEPRLVFCHDEAGGAVVVFSDGTSWRRVTDRAVVS